MTTKTFITFPDASQAKRSLLDMDEQQLADFLAELGEPKFRSRQIWEWIYKRYAGDFAAMSNLPKALRARLAE
ncbi:MAG: hypothetical protein KDE23_23345, partial [Caldilinea sp.]|nr:hypothetical protein [Caldilinea sp.]